MANAVMIKNYLKIRSEAVAQGTITPGDLVELISTGNVQRHSVAGGFAEKLFALEDDSQGKGIADNYVATDRVFLWEPTPGDQVYANVDAGSPTLAIGDTVSSAGNGKVTKSDLGSQSAAVIAGSIVGVCRSAGTAGGRVKIKIV